MMERALDAERGDLLTQTAVVLDYQRELSRQIKRPPSNDPIIAHMCAAQLTHDQHSPVLNFVYGELAKKSHNESRSMSSEYVGLVKSALLSYGLDRFPGTTPQDLDTMGWDTVLDQLDQDFEVNSYDSKLPASDFRYNLQANQVQTTVVGRYAIVKTIMQAMTPDRFPDGIRWLDIGPGNLTGNKALLDESYSHLFTFNDVRSNTYDTNSSANNLKDAANLLVRQPAAVKDHVALDEIPMLSPLGRLDWKRATWSTRCLRPGVELMDETFLSTYNELLYSSLPNTMRFIGGSLEDYDFDRVKEMLGDKKFDVITWVTSIHQNTLDKRRQMYQNAGKLLSEHGVRLIIDLAHLPKAKRPLPIERLKMFTREWTKIPDPYRTFIDDSHTENQPGLQYVASSSSTRAKKLKLSSHPVIVINGELTPLDALIAHS